MKLTIERTANWVEKKSSFLSNSGCVVLFEERNFNLEQRKFRISCQKRVLPKRFLSLKKKIHFQRHSLFDTLEWIFFSVSVFTLYEKGTFYLITQKPQSVKNQQIYVQMKPIDTSKE